MTEKACCIIFQDTLTFIVNAQFNLLRIDYASLTIPRVAFSNLNLKKWPCVCLVSADSNQLSTRSQ